MKYFPCLLALALFVPCLQSCNSETAKSGASVQNQTSPQPDSQQANETVVPAPSEFKEVFVGAIDDKHAVRMKLERNGAVLTGEYFYERAGAFNSAMKILRLDGRIEGDGSVTLTEKTYKNGEELKTGEFKGKLDGVNANGDLRLRFYGLWTGNNGKRLPFKLLQLRFELGGLKLIEKKEKSANDRSRYEIETALPQLTGADSSRVGKFNQAVAGLAAAHVSEFKKTADEFAREDPADRRDTLSSPPPSSLNVSYEITAANKDFISVLFYFYEYMRGAAHPNTATESFNYDLNRGAPVSLADLFTPDSNYLKVISDYSVRELKKLETADLAEEGAGPKIENFRSWNITPAGLKITFDNYQVGPYAAGEHVVVVPYSVLKPIITPDGLLSQFAK